MALLQKSYLGATPLFRNLGWFQADVNALADISSLVTVTANSSAHTKGAWSQLIASTSADSACIYLRVNGIGTSATNTATLLDIGTGATGSETAIISNVAVGGAAGSGFDPNGIYMQVPIQIPSGTRISARIQSVVTGGKTATVEAAVGGAGDYAAAPTSVDSIGGNTATSEAIGMSGSSGSWTQVVASTSVAYRAIVLVPSFASINRVSANLQFTIGVGASGSEAAFGVAPFRVASNETATSMWPCISLFGQAVAAGSRIAVKHNIASTPSEIQVTLIGIP
jgi:hypothetical protein